MHRPRRHHKGRKKMIDQSTRDLYLDPGRIVLSNLHAVLEPGFGRSGLKSIPNFHASDGNGCISREHYCRMLFAA
jgi:hypothetical protein